MKVAILTTDSREHFKDYHTPEPYFGTAPQALLQGFAEISGVEVHVISCLKERVAPTARIASNIFYHGLHVPGGWVRTLYSPAIKATRAKLEEVRPDIVHGQGTERECALAAVRSGFPNIITIHGLMSEVAKAMHAKLFSFHTLQARLEAWAIRRTVGVICLTNHAREKLRDRTPRTWVVPNAVDKSFFALNRTSAANRDIVCVGRIDRNKNQNFLIRALDSVAKDNGIRLIFLGGGEESDPYFQEFLALVKERPWCGFEGFQKGEALTQRLLGARLLVLASLEENCPMVILEAMAIGLPVAAAHSGGIPDLVQDGVTGLLFDPTNEQSAREVILKIVRNDAAAASMSSAGKQRALANHQPIRIAERHVQIYREALKTFS